MANINPYSPPSISSVGKRDISLPLEFFTPFLTAMVVFGFGVILATLVTIAVAAAIVVVVLGDSQLSPGVIWLVLAGIPAAFGVIFCGRIIGAGVLLDSSGIEIKTKKNRKYAWEEIASWRQDATTGIVSFMADNKLVVIANVATNRKRNEVIAEVFQLVLGPSMAAM